MVGEGGEIGGMIHECLEIHHHMFGLASCQIWCTPCEDDPAVAVGCPFKGVDNWICRHFQGHICHLRAVVGWILVSVDYHTCAVALLGSLRDREVLGEFHCGERIWLKGFCRGLFVNFHAVAVQLYGIPAGGKLAHIVNRHRYGKRLVGLCF